MQSPFRGVMKAFKQALSRLPVAWIGPDPSRPTVGWQREAVDRTGLERKPRRPPKTQGRFR
jgi:hypothetical protein